MALQAAYVQFLAAPNPTALTDDASLHYITTMTSFNNAAAIIKHFGTQRNQITKKKETVLDVVESHNALALRTETILEFKTSGGAYLPGLDDNFLADRVVSVPIIHMVAFDTNGSITRIQQSWDQAALLKDVEVIGSSGRNWPIRNGKDQITLISKAPATQPSQQRPATAASTVSTDSQAPTSRVNRDPHSSLDFSNRSEDLPKPVSPYAGSRPQQRTFEDVLGDQSKDMWGREGAVSPSKAVAPKAGGGKQHAASRLFDAQASGAQNEGGPVAPKAGGGKNFAPSRLFDDKDISFEPEASDKPAAAPQRNYKPHPTKYNHFDFADGSEPADAPKAGVAFEALPESKHRNAWNFEDFTTPAKHRPSKSSRTQEVRHWGTDQDDNNESPIKGYVQQHQPRRDADTHFELQDDGGSATPEVRQNVRPRGTAHNNGLGLYKNNVTNNEQPASPDNNETEQRPLGNITNLKDRSNTFKPHFDMADDSAHGARPKAQTHIAEDRQKAVKMMEAQWSSAYDKSPSSAQKENSHPMLGNGPAMPDQRIKLGGDGMGNSKAGRGWSIGDDGDDEPQAAAVPGKRAGSKLTSSLWDM